eukprot:jgi/Chlat1/8475/Chrsp80S07882
MPCKVGGGGGGGGWVSLGLLAGLLAAAALALQGLQAAGRRMADVGGLAASFLNSALSATGAAALPYEARDKYAVRQQLLDTIAEFPGLSLRTGVFVSNDGRQQLLLKAEGTVPMYYHNVKYNVPIVFWLPEGFPRIPPLVFVTPTPDMTIKPRHSFVDASGVCCNVPYLREWMAPRSNLLDLGHMLSIMFGQDPPLFARPTMQQPQPSTPPPPPPPYVAYPMPRPEPPPPPVPSASTSARVESPMQAYPPGWGANPPPFSLPQGSYGAQPVAQPSIPIPTRPEIKPPTPPPREDPKEVFKRRAVVALDRKLRLVLQEWEQLAANELRSITETKQTLASRTASLEQGIKDLRLEKERLEKALQSFKASTSDIEMWMLAHDRRPEDVAVDDVFVPADPLSKQVLDACAEDLAVDDVVYALDRALQQGRIEPDWYLKTVRSMSREQFFQRATAIKARATQMHSSSMPSPTVLAYR